MKKLLVVLVLVLVGTISYAQWSTNGTSIYYNSGNVGIGTSAPGAIFHVKSTGNANVRTESSYSGAALQTLGQFQSIASTGEQFLMAFRHNAGGYQDMLQSCKLMPSGVFAEFMYFRFDTQLWQMRPGVKDAQFQNNGNINFDNTGAIGVGLGTTPIPSGAKVAINGKLMCKEIEVTLTGLGDFVFNKDYKLRSLYDVENFINSNKHLPGVPSEAEVTENGMDLGKFNSVLLQKVEELTLYMIDLKKENDALKARISKLEK